MERDSAGITIVDNDLARLPSTCAVSSTPTVTIGTSAGAPEYELHRVFGATRLSDDRIVLVNQGTQQIRFYDQTGQFVAQTGRAGEGPGEFRRAYHLWVTPGDSIWVGDYVPWQFHIFGPDGTHTRTVRPMPLYANLPAGARQAEPAVLGAERSNAGSLPRSAH
ncbi:MAG: 6-bladed beta-propeller [Gemmatimonadota bacterium]